MFQHIGTAESHFVVPEKDRVRDFIESLKQELGDCEAVLTVRKPTDEAFTFMELDSVSTISVRSWRQQRKKAGPLSAKIQKTKRADEKRRKETKMRGAAAAPYDSALDLGPCTSSSSQALPLDHPRVPSKRRQTARASLAPGSTRVFAQQFFPATQDDSD